ncbi:hypothetical protein Scep_004762 [Stephania cephalantha]|uniref:Uncharacterized protein n=1 Tax=Stephania cephalantha TaxID=152367 RepID=A0AAP0KT08_9MAGN
MALEHNTGGVKCTEKEKCREDIVVWWHSHMTYTMWITYRQHQDIKMESFGLLFRLGLLFRVSNCIFNRFRSINKG